MTIHRYPDEVDAGKEAEGFYAEFAAKAAAGPGLPTEPVAARAAWREMAALSAGGQVYTSPKAEDLEVDADSGAVRLRVIEADDPSGIYLHMHAGGWTIGAADLDDARNEFLSRELGLTTVSVEYRLAPEDPYPAGLDDCEAAARWLMEDGTDRFGVSKLLIGGESAGANLAVTTALRLLKTPPAKGTLLGLNILYGNYDLTMTPSQEAGSAVLTPDSLRWFYDQYVPAERRRESELSPLYADLRGLPPVLLTAGTADALVDDSMFLYCRLLLAGVECELSLLPGADHGFDSMPLKVGKLGSDRIVEFLRKALN